MRPDRTTAALLWDMLSHAREAIGFMEGLTFEQFMQDRMLRLAVQHIILIIGKAASDVPKEFRDAHPDIPWVAIIKQRNVVAHDYGSIIDEKIWRVATVHIPEMIRLIEPIMPLPPPESSADPE